MEYLIINNILYNKSTDINNLATNFWHILLELSKDTGNPLFARVVDPANSSNILSELLSDSEKKIIINKAKESVSKQYWREIVW